jgi:hypothetical protein
VEILGKKINSFDSFINKNTLIVLFLIILIGLFLRGYKSVDRYVYAHDSDLYSWIVKDIVVNKHIRLIGQLTSTPGIFIGPIFYYSLVPFFLVANMDPVAGVIFGQVLAVFTILSFYYIFSKIVNKIVGLVAAFIQAVFISRVINDTWIVPTVTSTLWEVWYFFVLYMLFKGRFWVLPILGLLVGTIWHINFALAPSLLAVPVAIFLSKKLPTVENIAMGFLGLLIPSIPLFLFEAKHNFSQSRALIASFTASQGGGTGIDKLQHVLYQVVGNFSSVFFYPYRAGFWIGLISLIIFLVFSGYFIKKKTGDLKLLIVVLSWIFGVIFFFSVSSKIISEYYFANLNTLFICLFIIILSALYTVYKRGKIIVLLILCLFLLNGFLYVLDDDHYYTQTNYLSRKETVRYIAEDSRKKGYPCVSVTYITTEGNNVGFRYLFYLENLHVNQPISGSPVYNIVIPSKFAADYIKAKFGDIGVIPPEENLDKSKVKYSCSGLNSNLTDPLFGYTE